MNDIGQLIREGNFLYYKKKYQNAIEYYQKALQIEPGNIDAKVGLRDAQNALGEITPPFMDDVSGMNDIGQLIREGNSLYYKKKYQNAKMYYQKALQIEPGNIDAKVGLRDAQNALGEIVPFMDDVSGMNDIGQLIREGNSLYDKKRYHVAIEYYQKALQIEPGNDDAKILLKDAQDALDKTENSVDSNLYKKIYDTQPNSLDNFCGGCGKKTLEGDLFCSKCGKSLEKKSSSTEIESTENKIIDKPLSASLYKTDQSQADTLNIQGNEMSKAGKYAEAIEFYDKALALNQNHIGALNNKGFALYHLGKYDEALLCFDKVLIISPDDASTLNKKGKIFFELGKYEEAIACYNRALEANPSHTNSLKTTKNP